MILKCPKYVLNKLVLPARRWRKEHFPPERIEKIKLVLSFIALIILVICFVYLELRHAGNVSGVAKIFIIASALLIFSTLVIIPEYAPYASLSIFTFGLVVITLSVIRFLVFRDLGDIAIVKFVSGAVLVIASQFFRVKDWSFFKQDKKLLYHRNPPKSGLSSRV
ncbi:hypothetical protein CMO89_01820 [Candidatus Woesearchaeota archaeon]|nr:hypothetical protein [Candidatus Woesearchaeota archaeon]|tara:strand:- start:2126 stop:2620 length:495 start_codon:yes stop_codon:yes gene_type:complete